MQRIVTGSDTVITSPAFTDATGSQGAETVADVVVTVTSANGAVLEDLADPVLVVDEPGVYSVTIPASELADVDVLSVVWTGTIAGAAQRHVDQVEVAGGHYLTLIQMRALPDIKNTHTDEQLLAARDEFEDLAEEYTGRAWVPRYAVYHAPLWHDPLQLRRLPREIFSAVHGTHTINTSRWDLRPSGIVHVRPRIPRITPSSTIIRYAHGADYPPVSLVGATRDYVQGKILQRGNRVGRDTIAMADPAGGTTRYSTPDWDAGRPTGMFDVDRVLNSLGTDRWHGA